mgnify:CR=1 FL=1
MPLTRNPLKFLRAQAQTRKPVVTVGAAGLSAAVLAHRAAPADPRKRAAG